MADIAKGRIIGAYEARGGVVISHVSAGAAQGEDKPYLGVRLYIETLTVTEPLHITFGEPQVRSAYSRTVYRYSLSQRSAVLMMAEFLRANIYDPTRRKELDAVIAFCKAKDSVGREAARTALISTRG